MIDNRSCLGFGIGGLGAVILLLAAPALFGAEAAPSERSLAREILETTGVQGGLVVHLGAGQGKLTAALGGEGYLVHGLDQEAKNVDAARRHIQSLGLYGKVSVEQWEGPALPYAANLVNLVVAEDLGPVAPEEVLRVLAPGGVAYVKGPDGWTKAVKPWPDEIDEWTHYLHGPGNNAVARDTVVGPPRHVQWVAEPNYCRSHEIDSSVSALVSARGRVFSIQDEQLPGITDERLPARWSLFARDAFSGVLLWKRPVPRWGWREWKRAELEGKDWTGLRGQRLRLPGTLTRRLVAVENRVYVTLGYVAPVSELDAATGEVLREFEGTEGTDEILCDDGLLVLAVRRPDQKRSGNPLQADETSVVALRTEDGKILWRHAADALIPLSLAIDGGRVFFREPKAVVCLELDSGAPQWRVPGPSARLNAWNSAETLVAYDGVVLIAGPKGLLALAAEDGRTLWTGPPAKGPGVGNPPDLFVADGLVWAGAHTVGRDLHTGEVKRTVELHKLITPGHHFRCYRSKATEQYLLWPKRGVEFINLTSDAHMRHDWLRAPCKLGFMPCNGLLYMPPHQCFCYPGVLLKGFHALAARAEPAEKAAGARLQRGPAYGNPSDPPRAQGDSADDWPTLRHDPQRSGSTASAVPAALKRRWKVELGGRLSQPVVADGRLLVAAVDEHRVHCLESASGRALWSFTAGGRIDSPPTVYQGLVLFGSADGWVYALRAADGQLAWRFRAAPRERRVVAFGQLESAWPVHGSVLVLDGVVYCTAGRSSYLDGGIHLYGLDPKTGEKRYEACVEGPYPDITQEEGRPFDMEGTRSDVLVTDGTHLYLQQVVFDRRLVRQEAPRITNLGDRKFGRHVFSTAGFLDDTWWNRTFWMHAGRWPGFYIAQQAPKAGQLLVFDAEATYAVKCYTRRNRHSPMFFPATDGYLLFADDNDTEPALVDKTGNPRPLAWLPELNPATGWTLDTPGVDRDKGVGFVRTEPPKWAQWVPIRIRAMTLAAGTLFVAGPPDVLDPDDPMAAFEGRLGAHLRAVSASDGKPLAEYRLDAPPVFDGLIAAEGHLFLSTSDGAVLCFQGEQPSD